MSEWKKVRFGELFEVIYRYPTYYGIEYVEDGIKEIRGELLLDNGKILDDYRQIKSETAKRFPKVHLKEGDLVISVRGTLGKVGLATQKHINAIITANLLKLSPNRLIVDSNWLLQILISRDFKNKIESACSQTTIKTIQIPLLSNLIVLKPSKYEQHKIAKILTTVDNLIEKTEALIAKYQSIKQGMMQDLFTRGVDESGHLRPPYSEAPHLFKQSELGWIPKEWKVANLDTITQPEAPICYGIVQPGIHEESGVPIVAINSLHSDYKSLHRSSLGIEAKYIRSRIKGKDVLISIKGTIGRVDIVPEWFLGNISRDIARIRPREDISPIFLKLLFESPIFGKQVMNSTVGTTRDELSINVIKKLHVFLPPINEQNSIFSTLEQINTTINSEKKHLQKRYHLKSGLMQDLLTGKVRVKVDEQEEVMASS